MAATGRSQLPGKVSGVELAWQLDSVSGIAPSTRVEVRSRFDQHWARGFEVAGVHDGRYLLRRMSDGVVLGGDFSSEEVRPDLR